ncbi:MAG: tRNA glutamyl-Q(34) synthetase GluQRS [Steroidobacteraceae bacterium]
MYVGRFAPSPTGSLHLGSLLAAVGSYLEARSRGGRWLVRMEDLDRARIVPGSAAKILRTLEAFGLGWDGEVEYQSHRTHLYAEALESLRAGGLTFECSCSRRELATEESGYPGTCREGPRRPGATATRLRVDETATIAFDDRFQGPIALPMDKLGDVIVRRRDGVFPYQLAVVVDDALQRVTDVVRGADLLESTGWQIALQRALRLPTPRYAHLPLLLERSGEKLSKSRRSVALDVRRAGGELLNTLRLLGLSPPAELAGAAPATLLKWATACWRAPPPLARELILPAVSPSG